MRRMRGRRQSAASALFAIDGRRSTFAATIALLSILAVFLELTTPGVARWAATHTLTTAFVTGGALLALTVLGVETLLRKVESQRWRAAAHEALNVYVFAADNAITRIVAVLNEHDSRPESISDIYGVLALAKHDSDSLRRISNAIRKESEHVGIVAMGAAQIIVRDDALVGAAQVAFRNQRRFDEAADLCWHLAWIGPGLGGQNVRLRDLGERWAARISELLSSVRNDLTDLRIAVLQSRDIER